MANKLTVTAELNFAPDDETRSTINPGLFSMVINNVSGGVTYATQLIDTEGVAVVVSPNITEYGWIFVKNLDDTNYVELATMSAKYTMRLNAKEFCFFRAANNALNVRANTAACMIEFWVFED